MRPIKFTTQPATSLNASLTSNRAGLEPGNMKPIKTKEPATTTDHADLRDLIAPPKAGHTKATSPRAAIDLGVRIFDREMQAREGNPISKQAIERRFNEQKYRLINSLNKIYGSSMDEVYKKTYNIEDALEAIIPKITKAALTHADAPHQASEENKQDYLQSNKRACATVYLDKTCDSLRNIDWLIETLKKLNIDIVHLLPTLYPSPEGTDDEGKPIDSDGGYAINSHRKTNPHLGYLPGENQPPALEHIFQQFLREDIRVIADFTINHTSEQSKYYTKWKEGAPKYEDFYIAVNDEMREVFDEKMPPFFPLLRNGNFTRDQETGKYIMSRFKNSQKDLNWRNPAVAAKMFSDMFFLANAGADLRIDAAPVMFKRLGTNCINLPEVFHLMEALRAAMEIVAPSKFMLAESIMTPSKVLPFLERGRCELSYNTAISTNNLPAIATQDVTLLRDSLYYFVQKPELDGIWLNAERTHDDFFMQLDDLVAQENQVDKPELNTRMHQFFTGDQQGSYARGVAFLSSPELGQFAGTLASLLGLEQALEHEDSQAIDKAVARINLTKAIRYALPGIPLVNLLGGDHVGSINNPIASEDTRDVHRIPYEKLHTASSLLHKKAADTILNREINLLSVRKKNTAFSGKEMLLLDTGNPSLLSFNRKFGSEQCLVIGNYAETSQAVDLSKLHPYLPPSRKAGGGEHSFSRVSFEDSVQFDAIEGKPVEGARLTLDPHQAVWLVSKPLN